MTNRPNTAPARHATPEIGRLALVTRRPGLGWVKEPQPLPPADLDESWAFELIRAPDEGVWECKHAASAGIAFFLIEDLDVVSAELEDVLCVNFL